MRSLEFQIVSSFTRAPSSHIPSVSGGLGGLPEPGLQLNGGGACGRAGVTAPAQQEGKDTALPRPPPATGSTPGVPAAQEQQGEGGCRCSRGITERDRGTVTCIWSECTFRRALPASSAEMGQGWSRTHQLLAGLLEASWPVLGQPRATSSHADISGAPF